MNLNFCRVVYERGKKNKIYQIFVDVHKDSTFAFFLSVDFYKKSLPGLKAKEKYNILSTLTVLCTFTNTIVHPRDFHTRIEIRMTLKRIHE